MKNLEAHLAFLGRNRPHVMSEDQRNIARVQHECRVLRGAESACDEIQGGIGRACEECLRRAQVNQK